MSSVVVQIGQCGNQTLQHFWELCFRHYDSHQSDGAAWMADDGKFRSVNVDTEPKVIDRLLVSHPRRKLFRDENIILGKRGRGCNWAMGYFDQQCSDNRCTPRDGNILETCVNCIRKEAERCDAFSGFLLSHSLSGGTGSGFGSRLCASLRDEFPLAYIMSLVVAPFQSGESPLQHYNCLLSLATLQQHSDCIVLFENDDVLSRTKKSELTSTKVPKPLPSLQAMNQAICQMIAGNLFPINENQPKGHCSLGTNVWDLVRQCCPMPQLKFTHQAHSLLSKSTWNRVLDSFVHQCRRHDRGDHRVPWYTVSAVASARGGKFANFLQSRDLLSTKIRSHLNCVNWNPFPLDLWFDRKCSFANDASSLSVTMNSSRCNWFLERTLDNAYVMFNENAFLHSYYRYGCEKADFECAFERVTNVVADYKMAGKVS